MAGVNKVILLGNLGSDPEIRHFDTGSVVAHLSIATTETYKDRSGQRVDNTEWHDVELWDNTAKVAEQYLKKGDPVYIEGKIRTDKWQDADGNQRRKIKIRGQVMQLLPKRMSEQTVPTSQQQTPTSQANPAPIDQTANDQVQNPVDDLPF